MYTIATTRFNTKTWKTFKNFQKLNKKSDCGELIPDSTFVFSEDFKFNFILDFARAAHTRYAEHKINCGCPY